MGLSDDIDEVEAPGDDEADPPARAEVSGDEYASSARFPQHADLWSDAEVKQHGLDEEADLRVRGQWLDDEPGHVQVHLSNQFVRFLVSVSPDEARAVAADLLEAADHVEPRSEH